MCVHMRMCIGAHVCVCACMRVHVCSCGGRVLLFHMTVASEGRPDHLAHHPAVPHPGIPELPCCGLYSRPIPTATGKALGSEWL